MSARIFLLLAMVFCCAADGNAAAIASGRNWRLSIDRIECEAAESRLIIGTRIDYLGPRGPVEAPVIQLIDAEGRQYLPRSLVWRHGSKQLAAWLSSGGLSNIQSEYIGEMQLKFEVRGAAGDLKLEFGDIKALALTRKRTSACEGLLKPDQLQAARMSRPARAGSSKPGIRIYRAAYPCIPQRTSEAEYPPYLPRQLLLFGRGYLPNARQIELPMGRAAAQSYSYVGPDSLDAIEDAARRALMADFPEYGAGSKYFAFDWGTQKAASGNELYSIAIYDLRTCPK
ncbi:MAG TPA: hypothetical protein VGX52_08155 [Burkholderiales bacterium]|nr:hypothetical protein [Burkholderiales bacterium]